MGSPWQMFGALWGMNKETLRAAWNRAMNQRSTSTFLDTLKQCMDGVLP